MTDGHDGFLVAAPASDSMILRGEVAAPSPHGAARTLDQRRA